MFKKMLKNIGVPLQTKKNLKNYMIFLIMYILYRVYLVEFFL